MDGVLVPGAANWVGAVDCDAGGTLAPVGMFPIQRRREFERGVKNTGSFYVVNGACALGELQGGLICTPNRPTLDT